MTPPCSLNDWLHGTPDISRWCFSDLASRRRIYGLSFGTSFAIGSICSRV